MNYSFQDDCHSPVKAKNKHNVQAIAEFTSPMNQATTSQASAEVTDASLSITDQQLPIEWEAICNGYSSDVKHLVHDLACTHKAALADLFYDQMMNDHAASFFLSDQLVKTKLNQTMQLWIDMVFSAAIKQSYEDVVNYQKKIGSVHARIGIPTHLVMHGARALNLGLFALLKPHHTESAFNAASYISQIVSLAIEIMCHSYSSQHERNSRTEESYRLFAISQNISTEKERQRAALLDWENQLMFNITVQQHENHFPRLMQSDFGLWFLHKAAHIFEGSEDVNKIQAYIQSIDETLDQISHTTEFKNNIDVLLSIRDKTKAISFLLNDLFEQESALEAGRDALTNLLNRKYLHVIMSREIGFARKNKRGLAILAIDIDYFKKINDTYGHDIGDTVLQHVAVLLQNQIRGSDYIFRIGGEEFLVILPDINPEQAIHLAEKLRHKLDQENIPLPNHTSLHITMSIGVAQHTGHPDYMRLLKAADTALYDAKNQGRNRVSNFRPEMSQQ